MNRPNGIFKISNCYQKILKNYSSIPKSVLGAILVSKLSIEKNEKFDLVEDALYEEWQILYANGIVPQKPKRKF